jgi:hypothetical protein
MNPILVGRIGMGEHDNEDPEAVADRADHVPSMFTVLKPIIENDV